LYTIIPLTVARSRYVTGSPGREVKAQDTFSLSLITKTTSSVLSDDVMQSSADAAVTSLVTSSPPWSLQSAGDVQSHPAGYLPVNSQYQPHLHHHPHHHHHHHHRSHHYSEQQQQQQLKMSLDAAALFWSRDNNMATSFADATSCFSTHGKFHHS